MKISFTVTNTVTKEQQEDIKEACIEVCRKERNELGKKYNSSLVDCVSYKMSDKDFLKYVEVTIYFQELSGESSIGKMGFVLKDALKERPIECLEELVDLLSALKSRKSILGLEESGKERARKEIEHYEQTTRLRVIERKYGVTDDEELEELPRKIKNPDDLVSYYQAKAIQITSEGFYPRILDYGVEHDHITEEVRKKIDIERERFKRN